MEISTLNEITQTDIDKAFENHRTFNNVDPVIIPTPTRTFELEEEVRLGNLDDVIIKEILFDGKAYRTEFTRSTRPGSGRSFEYTRETSISWWFEIRKIDFSNKDADDLFVEYLPGQISTSDISSFIGMMAHSGMVCDPRYQRGYVWSLSDQEALIDSIFNRISLGSFVFSRNAGYHHNGSDETVKYITLDGDEVEIKRCDDYTVAIVDGQQRMTTIWRFMTNQFTYKGRYWKDLSFHDQNNFKSTLVSYRIFEERDVPYEDVLRMFLLVNKGVPQDASHLAAVEKKLAEFTK